MFWEFCLGLISCKYRSYRQESRWQRRPSPAVLELTSAFESEWTLVSVVERSVSSVRSFMLWPRLVTILRLRAEICQCKGTPQKIRPRRILGREDLLVKMLLLRGEIPRSKGTPQKVRTPQDLRKGKVFVERSAVIFISTLK